MPKDKSTGKKLADMMYGNPERAAFGVFPQMKPKRSKQDPEAAKNFPLDLARGVVAGAVGIPGDIESLARLPYELYTGNESPTFLPTSEDVLKRIPFGSNTPASQFASGLGILAGGSANIGAAPRIIKKGALAAGRAGERLAEKAVPEIMERGGAGADILSGLARNTQSPMIVYHGSPHKFSPTKKNPLGEFNPKKIGTGEGNQAYGIGHYTAEAREVAEEYAKNLANRDMGNQGRLNAHANAKRLAELAGDPKYAADDVRFVLENDPDHPQKELLQNTLAFLESGDYAEPLKNAGNLYTIDLSDEKIARMLDYDKPLSAQHPDVQKALLEHPDVLDYMAKAEGQRTRLNEMSPVRLEKIPSASVPYDASRMAGKDVMTAIAQRSGLGGEQGAVEEQLRQLGIPGIRYLDQGSRATPNVTNQRLASLLNKHEGNAEAAVDEMMRSVYNTPKQMQAMRESFLQQLQTPKTSNFVVFPGEEDALTIVDRKKEGGRVHISDNPDVMQLELAKGGAVAALKRLARATPKSKQEIEAIAERMAPQVTGEYVRKDAKSAKTVADKTQKQFQREKTLPVDVRATDKERIPQTVDIEKLKGDVMIGIPGDPTLAGKSLYGVGDVRLGSPSPQHGGPLYGLYNDENFWASGLGAARRVQNLAKEAGEQYDAPVAGKYIMMGPDSINYAQHFADANLQAIDLERMTKKQVEQFNKLIRFGNPKSGPRPSFPGIEDKESAYLHMAMDPELRKHFNELMQKPTVTEALNLPSGTDIRFAITEPALRNLETGVTGFSMGRMRPEISSKDLPLSTHPTYSHDIPGDFMGQSQFPIPYELSFPDTLKSIRENPDQAPHEFGSLKMIGPRQTIDQQMIDEIKAYEERMKALTGKKKGGAVRKYADGGEITADDLILEERKL